jgi:hypothetical protein
MTKKLSPPAKEKVADSQQPIANDSEDLNSAEPLEEAVDFPELIKAISQDLQSIDDGLVAVPNSYTESLKAMQLDLCDRCGDQHRIGMSGHPLCPLQLPDCERHQSS